MQAQKPGQSNGLFIYVSNRVNNNAYSFDWYEGMVVFVQNSSLSRPDFETNSIRVEAGKETLVQIERTFRHKQAWPYSECKDLSGYSSELFDSIRNSNVTYRQKDCFDLCTQKKIVEKCHCYSLRFPRLEGTFAQPCLNLTEYACSSSINVNLDECVKFQCPLECHSIIYDFSLSSWAYPSVSNYERLGVFGQEYYASLLNKTYISYAEYASLFASFVVFYPSLEYIQITEEPKITVVDLLTQIGGSMGLFVSFSVFTLFELLEIGFLVVSAFIRQNRRKLKNKYELKA